MWKDLGLGVRDAPARFVLPDDPRLADVFATAGALGLPVLIHTADPVAFWQPLDERNERLEELGAHPEWWFGDGGVPVLRARCMEAFAALVAAHPQTTFIGAHVVLGGRGPRARGAAGSTRYPNLHLDISARLGELGRQPRATRRADRSATPTACCSAPTPSRPTRGGLRAARARFLETADEHFAYGPDPDDPTPQGRWRISGLELDPPSCSGAVHARTPGA